MKGRVREVVGERGRIFRRELLQARPALLMLAQSVLSARESSGRSNEVCLSVCVRACLCAYVHGDDFPRGQSFGHIIIFGPACWLMDFCFHGIALQAKCHRAVLLLEVSGSIDEEIMR